MLILFIILSKGYSFHLLISEFEDPIYNTSLFDITLTLTDNLASLNKQNITAHLYSSETETESLFTGKKSCLTDQHGSCDLDNLLIHNLGVYHFVFKVNELEFFSSEIEVLQGFSSIVISTSKSVISAYTLVTLEVFVFNNNGDLWDYDWVEYTIQSTGLFFDQNSGIFGFCVDGHDSVSTFIDTAGVYNISVTSGAVESSKIQLEVKENKLKFMEVSLTEMFVGSELKVKIGVFDQEYQNLAQMDQYSYVDLVLKSEELTLNTSVQVKNGIALFENIRLGKAGNYQLAAESFGRAPIAFEPLIQVKKFPLGSIILNTPENITAFFEFSLDIELLNTNGTAFTDPCTLTLSTNASISGTTQLTPTNGKGSFNLYSRETGNLTLYLDSNLTVSNHSQLTVQSPVLQINPNAFLFDSSNCFNINITVLDFNKSQKRLTENLTISLSLAPKGKLFGQTESETLNGAASFQDLTILTKGNFSFEATLKSLSVLSVGSTEQKFQISEYQVHLPKDLQKLTRLLVFVEDFQVNAFFGFVVRVLLLDQIQENFKQDCEVGVTGNNSVYGETLKALSSGESSFEVYTKVAGGLGLLTTACGSLTNKTELVVLPLSGSIEVEEVMGNESKEFDVTVKVMDFYGRRIEEGNGLYEIGLVTSPISNVSGQCHVNQVKGGYTFRNLTISPKGNYTFNANITESESSTMIFITSKVFSVPEKELSNYPMITFISLFWLMVIFCVIFYINDRNFMLSENEKDSVYKYLSVLSFNSPGPNHFRIVSVLRIFSSSYTTFTLLGLFHHQNIFTYPPLENFSFQILWESILILFISQALTLPLALIHFFNLENNSACKIVSALCVLIICNCFGLGIWLIRHCDPLFFTNWVVIFAVFTGIDLILLQTLYGYFFYQFHKNNENSQSTLFKKEKNLPLLSPPLPFRSPRQTPVRSTITPSFLKSPNLDFEYIKRSTITPSVRKFFVFDENTVSNYFKNQSLSTQPSLPKSPKISFPKRK